MPDGKYEFTELLPSHYQACKALWKNTEGMGQLSDTEESLKNYIARNHGMSFVCIESATGNIVGADLAGHDGRRGFIYHLAVDKAHRGNSIGKKLVELSVNAVKREGIQRLIIMVLTGHDSGHNFWKHIGWKARPDLNMYSLDIADKT
jgi:GNAT superfamily N-acetyltransferase